jgi:cytoskeletal protein CcmA (bactofilin family)
MSLFGRKPPGDAEPTPGEQTRSKTVEGSTEAVVDGMTSPEAPPATPAQSGNTPSDPDKRMSRSDKPEGAHMASSRTPSAGFVPEIPRRTIDLPGAPGRKPGIGQRGGSIESKKLIVGREISLSGEITACESLIVEGSVEATLENSQFLEIAEGGLFKGTVVIDEAVISGSFKGTITARERLTVRSTGRITGTVRFNQIEIELGGEIDGDIHVLRSDSSPEAAADS